MRLAIHPLRNTVNSLAFGFGGRARCARHARSPALLIDVSVGLLGVVSGRRRLESGVMETRQTNQEDQGIAKLKLHIIRQQEIVARLVRDRQSERARQARAKLFAMLNQLELMES